MPASASLGAPILACMLASIVFATPVRILGLRPPEPVFALVPAFAWGMMRPSIWPPVALVGLGLFLDLLWGAPMGLWPFCLLSAYALTFAVRRVLSGQEFWALWGWYVAACGLAMTCGLVLMGLRAGHLPSIIGAGWQFAISATLFPFAWRLVERYQDADARFR